MTAYAVVGGGITGLAAAWELARRGATDVVVHDPGHLGGKLRTSSFAGRLVDEGADAFLARVPWGRELCDELGIGADLVSPADGRAYVAHDHELQALPTGLVLGVPTDADALRASAVVSADAADRVAREPELPGAPLAPGDDVTVGELIRRRFGDEVLERLVEPLLGAINAGDTDRLSVRASAPQIAEAAERSPSLVTALRAAPAAPSPGPVFWTHPQGMGAIAERLVAALRAASVVFATDPVTDLAALAADRVVLATPAPVTADLVGAAGAAEAAGLLRSIAHASPVLVTLAFSHRDVVHPLDASGLLVPRTEGRLLTACSFASTKWAHLGAADPETVVLRVSAGRLGDDRAIGTDDDELIAGLLADLDALIGLRGAPLEVRVSRWPAGFPQYEKGHLDRIAAIETDLRAALPHVRVAGAAYRGIGVPACIRQGREAAASLWG